MWRVWLMIGAAGMGALSSLAATGASDGAVAFYSITQPKVHDVRLCVTPKGAWCKAVHTPRCMVKGCASHPTVYGASLCSMHAPARPCAAGVRRVAGTRTHTYRMRCTSTNPHTCTGCQGCCALHTRERHVIAAKGGGPPPRSISHVLPRQGHAVHRHSLVPSRSISWTHLAGRRTAEITKAVAGDIVFPATDTGNLGLHTPLAHR